MSKLEILKMMKEIFHGTGVRVNRRYKDPLEIIDHDELMGNINKAIDDEAYGKTRTLRCPKCKRIAIVRPTGIQRCPKCSRIMKEIEEEEEE